MYFGPGFAITNFNVVKRFPLPMLGEAGPTRFPVGVLQPLQPRKSGSAHRKSDEFAIRHDPPPLWGPATCSSVSGWRFEAGRRSADPIGLVLSVVPAAIAPAAAFQGMAVPNARVRPARQSARALPPIAVDFRDMAPAAGMTCGNVSGAPDSKQYILETTGSGVAILDYDDDGLMDIFLVNGTTPRWNGKTEQSLVPEPGQSAVRRCH